MWGEKCKQRIASQLHRIRHWTIQQDSYEVLDPDDQSNVVCRCLPIRRWVSITFTAQPLLTMPCLLHGVNRYKDKSLCVRIRGLIGCRLSLYVRWLGVSVIAQ